MVRVASSIYGINSKPYSTSTSTYCINSLPGTTRIVQVAVTRYNTCTVDPLRALLENHSTNVLFVQKEDFLNDKRIEKAMTDVCSFLKELITKT